MYEWAETTRRILHVSQQLQGLDDEDATDHPILAIDYGLLSSSSCMYWIESILEYPCFRLIKDLSPFFITHQQSFE